MLPGATADIRSQWIVRALHPSGGVRREEA
jgi:hypothetical protein